MVRKGDDGAPIPAASGWRRRLPKLPSKRMIVKAYRLLEVIQLMACIYRELSIYKLVTILAARWDGTRRTLGNNKASSSIVFSLLTNSLLKIQPRVE